MTDTAPTKDTTAMKDGTPSVVSEAEEEGWRGIVAAESEEADGESTPGARRRTRRLVVGMLAPRRGMIAGTAVLALSDTAMTLAPPLIIAAVIDRALPSAARGDYRPAVWCVVAYTLVAALSGVLRGVLVSVGGRVGQDFLLDLRRRVFDHAQRLCLAFHERYTSGRMIARMTSDLDRIAVFLEDVMNDFVATLLSTAMIIAMLIWLDPTLSLVMLASLIPLALAGRWYKQRSQQAHRRSSTTSARMISHFVETVNGIRAVIAYRREPINSALMDRAATAHRDAQKQTWSVLTLLNGISQLIGNITLTIALLVGAWRVNEGVLALGTLTAFLLYLHRFYSPLDELARMANSFAGAAAGLEKITQVLDERPSVAEPTRPRPLPRVRGEVRFEGVEFRYRPLLPPALSRLDLSIPAGQTVAVVGPTGAGKSSLAKLLVRFYDPTRGRVSLDGVDLREIAETDLRRAVAMLTQESFMFAGTIGENIALGRPSASRAEIETAAAKVGADFIRELPEGFDTDVHKRGGRLSAGQRQLVALSRALLADPAVLVLDEATASLDLPTERVVQEAMRTVLAERTSIIIAHRLSTVLLADRVLVVDHGEIVEDDTPTALLATGGRFAKLHEQWRASLA